MLGVCEKLETSLVRAGNRLIERLNTKIVQNKFEYLGNLSGSDASGISFIKVMLHRIEVIVVHVISELDQTLDREPTIRARSLPSNRLDNLVAPINAVLSSKSPASLRCTSRVTTCTQVIDTIQVIDKRLKRALRLIRRMPSAVLQRQRADTALCARGLFRKRVPRSSDSPQRGVPRISGSTMISLRKPRTADD